MFLSLDVPTADEPQLAFNTFTNPTFMSTSTLPSRSLHVQHSSTNHNRAIITVEFYLTVLFFFHLTYSRWTPSVPSCLWSQRIFPSLPGSRLTIFYRDASSALLQLVNQWLNFTIPTKVKRVSHPIIRRCGWTELIGPMTNIITISSPEWSINSG